MTAAASRMIGSSWGMEMQRCAEMFGRPCSQKLVFWDMTQGSDQALRQCTPLAPVIGPTHGATAASTRRGQNREGKATVPGRVGRTTRRLGEQVCGTTSTLALAPQVQRQDGSYCMAGWALDVEVEASNRCVFLHSSVTVQQGARCCTMVIFLIAFFFCHLASSLLLPIRHSRRVVSQNV